MSETHIGWLLQQLEATDGVEYAVLVASDGMSPDYTPRLSRERAEKIAAITSTLWAASRAYDHETDGEGVRQVLMESVGHISLLIPAGKNTLLAVRTSSPHSDIGVIGEAALRLATSVGDHLGVKTRVTSSSGSAPA
ncbi:roadblock/LC7 domain-containing protein [Streptomyces sp. NPDC046821]|uniref:roadblock/LC7 domain-containing protein n=1 Tax=Streptomyces sp. NPDC046821 TaxID=3154702 RepID=UPI0033C5CB18